MKQGKTILFYGQLKMVVEKSVKLNIKKLGASAFLRCKVEEDCDEFVKHQDYLKRIDKSLYNRDVVALMIGEVLFKFIKGISSKEKVEMLSDTVYEMYVYGENPMCCPDVTIYSNCMPVWEKKFLA